MVIGNGLIAGKFEAYREQERFVVFASGVSRSKNTDNSEYERERTLLLHAIEAHPDKELVYFSTCSIYDPEEKLSPYVQHKKAMEDMVRSKALHYHIFRLSNVVGHGGNPNTIFNFFVNSIRGALPFELWLNAGRNFIDVDDMFLICDYILQQGLWPDSIINVANVKNIQGKELTDKIAAHLGKTAVYQPVSKGSSPDIDLSQVLPLAQQLGIKFDDQYIERLLNKYIPNDI